MSKNSTLPSFLRGASTPPHLATLVILAGSSVMAMNIFLPMLPAIGTSFNVGPASAQYVLTIFLFSTAIAQLFVGPLSDRFGRRPILISTAILFILATLVCIFSTSFEMLLVGRTLQAVSASGISLSRAIVRDMFDRSKAASMIGYVTMAMAVLPMVSPSIGGLSGETLGWQGPFVILLVVGIIVLFLLYFDLGETHFSEPIPTSQQFRNYWSLIKEPAIWGYFLCASFASGAYFAFLGGAPFVGQTIIGMPPSTFGVYLGMVAIGYMAGNFLSGRFSERVGIEPMMIYGNLVACVGVGITLFLMYKFEPQAEFLFYPMILVGLGNGMTLPNAAAGAVSVRPELAGTASGLGGSLQIGGGAALAVLAGNLITVENQAMPLYAIMFITSLAAAIIGGFMAYSARQIAIRTN